jgi:hypothetical protein
MDKVIFSNLLNGNYGHSHMPVESLQARDPMQESQGRLLVFGHFWRAGGEISESADLSEISRPQRRS